MRASPHTYDTHPLGARDRICISRYPDSHLSRSSSSIGKADFPSCPQCRVLLYCNSVVFCFDTRSIPKDSRLEGQQKPTMMEHTSKRENHKKKDVWKTKEEECLVSRTVDRGRTAHARWSCCVCGHGHHRTCLPQTNHSIDLSNS